MDNVIENEQQEPDPTCNNCAAWTGEECRSNPPAPLLIEGKVISIFPRTAGTAWCLQHVPADEPQIGEGEQNG